jgi:hypothetical protein
MYQLIHRIYLVILYIPLIKLLVNRSFNPPFNPPFGQPANLRTKIMLILSPGDEPCNLRISVVFVVNCLND